MSEPTTAAGRALLEDSEYEDEGEWIVSCYTEELPERIAAIEAEAVAAFVASDDFRATVDVARLARAITANWAAINRPTPTDDHTPFGIAKAILAVYERDDR